MAAVVAADGDDALSCASDSTNWTVSSLDDSHEAQSTQPAFALQAAPLGAQKCAQIDAATEILVLFKAKCKIAAGIAPTVAAKIALCTTLPHYTEPLVSVVPWSLHKTAAPKIAATFASLSPSDKRVFLAAALKEVAPSLPRSAAVRAFASASASSVLTEWSTAMDQLPPSVRKNIEQRSTLQAADCAVPATSLLSVLALTQDTYQDLLCDLFGRIPTQFMRRIDDVVDSHAPHMFGEQDTSRLVSLIFEIDAG